MASALSLDNDQIGDGLRDELIAASSKLLDGVPVSRCESCGAGVFTHEAVTIDDAVYCTVVFTLQPYQNPAAPPNH